MPLVITIDIEDWAQTTLGTEYPITARAERNVNYLLDLLAEEKVKVTCFVQGKLAEKYPDCVRRIVADGHELASHGYGHVELVRLDPAAFREDVRRSKQHLEDLTGQAVRGYRAPCLSMVSESLWALDILAEEGFLYDSSINPAPLRRLAMRDWPPYPVRLELAGGAGLVELPVASLAWLGRRWPVAGGGYHRLLPWGVIRYAVRQILANDGVFTSYCHPYEFDSDEFKHLDFKIALKTRLHQGLGRRGLEAKFRKLLRFSTPVQAIRIAERSELPVFKR